MYKTYDVNMAAVLDIAGYHTYVLYSLKFSRVKNFDDFCVALKILLSKILVLQRRLLKLNYSPWFKVVILLVIHILSAYYL